MSYQASLFERVLDESSSDDDDEIHFAGAQIFHYYSQSVRKHGGSIPGHVVKYRDREGAHLQMCQDYLEDDSRYSPTDFRRRFVFINLFLVYFVLYITKCLLSFLVAQIVRGATRFWDEETLGDIMKACIIMHNMIIENEGEQDPNERFDYGGENVEPFHEQDPDLDKFIETHKKIRDNQRILNICPSM